METILLSALDAPNRRAILEVLDRHTLIELSGRAYNPASLHKLVEDISNNDRICSNIELQIRHVTF